MDKKKQPTDEVTGRPVQPFTQLDTSFNGITETTPLAVKRRLDAALRRAEKLNAAKKRRKK